MLYYDRIDASKGIHVLMLMRQVHQKSVIFVTNCFFFNYSFKCQPNACNRCHDLFIMSINLSDIAILNIKGSDYHCIISLTSKNDAINLLQNADLSEKCGTL